MKADIVFLDAKLLRAFRAAAEELHFGRAAARLHMSQPPFSQQIKRLEETIGAPLFIRTTRSVRLTPAGTVMQQRLRRLAEDTAAMVKEVRRAAAGEAGRLAIGIAPTAAHSPVVDALYGYRQAHPDVALELRELNSHASEDALRKGVVDVAIMRPVPMAQGMRAVTVFTEPMLLAVRHDHPLAPSARVTLAQATGTALVGYRQAVSPYFRDMLHRMFSRAGRVPHFVQESELPTILTLVEAGAGAAVVPRSVSLGHRPALRFVPIAARPAFTAQMVLAHLMDTANPAVRRFVESIQRQVKATASRPNGDNPAP